MADCGKKGLYTEHVSLLASLAPVVEEEITADGTVLHHLSPEVLYSSGEDEDNFPITVRALSPLHVQAHARAC